MIQVMGTAQCMEVFLVGGVAARSPGMAVVALPFAGGL
jgi:hypothetical protein